MILSETYPKLATLADLIELELRRMDRWTGQPLSDDKYDDMGAFGINKMTFGQWIQFILLVRIRTIIRDRGELPEQSNVSVYAVRALDGDDEANHLFDLLRQLDDLINQQDEPAASSIAVPPALGSVDDLPIPPVLYQLAGTLPDFEGGDLESQLQTYDVFLNGISQEGREAIVALFIAASGKAKTPASRQRLITAAQTVRSGANAAAPYDHEETMRKYREEFKKGYEK